MTARDLFAELDPPGGLGIPPSTEAKVPGAVGSTQPQAEARTPIEGRATAEAPSEIQTCGTCNHAGNVMPGGFLRCDLGKSWQAFSPKATCQIFPVQWKAIDPARTPRAGQGNNPEKGHGSAPQSVSRNGGGGAEASAAGPPASPVDSRETTRYQIGNSEPGPHSTRDASMAAITRLRAEGLITERQKELLEFYASRPAAANYTRQEIAKNMMARHGPKWAINQVCGRVNELIKVGRLRELQDPRRCNVTNELVNAIERGVW